MRLWDLLWGTADNYFSRNELEQIKELENTLKLTNATIESYQRNLQDATDKIANLQGLVKIYQQQDAQAKQDQELETFWNTKRPSVSLTYNARPIYGNNRTVAIDPRTFWTEHDSTIPYMAGTSNDLKAEKCRAWVEANIEYEPEHELFKIPECWLYAWETLLIRKGDCEDGAILMANMMLRSGIPYWRIRLNAGDVLGGGHAWVTYLREIDNKWVILDWCYWPEDSKDLQLLWEDAEKHYFKIWFSWNVKYTFADSNYDR